MINSLVIIICNQNKEDVKRVTIEWPNITQNYRPIEPLTGAASGPDPSLGDTYLILIVAAFVCRALHFA